VQRKQRKSSYPLVQPAMGALVHPSMSRELSKSERGEGKEAHWCIRRQMQWQFLWLNLQNWKV